MSALALGGMLPQKMQAAKIAQVVQQSKVVKGQVLDSAGDPVIGATVKVKGSSEGTITDLDGNYTINVAEGATLEISYIGYQTQLVKVNGSVVNVKLQDDSQNLNEVVVVGYGVQKKSDVTGSVTSINKDRLGKIPVTNVLQAVQGSAPGVTITQTSSIPGDAPDALVRGKNSINASSGPYIVVDGVPISKSGGTLNDINPNDIESMEILKDASATAIYGTNGSNGVILVTTKRGKDGKPTVRYSGYLGIEDFAKKLPFASGAEQLARYKEYVRVNNLSSSTLKDGGAYNDTEIDNIANGNETDWIDAVSQTGLTQNHNVSVSGGGENVKYFMSGDIMDQKGVLKGFNYKRYSFRVNLDANVTKYLKIGTSSYIVSHNKDGGRVNFTMAQAMSPYAQMYNEDGSYTIYPMNKTQIWTNPFLPTTSPHERRQWNINVNGYAEVDFGNLWKPLAGLTYKLNLGYSYMPKRDNEYTSTAGGNTDGGYAAIRNDETQSYIAENIVTYARDIAKHHFDITALYAASRKKYQWAKQTATSFVNDEQLWHNMAAASTYTASSHTELYSTISQMGRLNYSYDSRYLFTFTVRRDGSSVFGDSNKYGVFPSVALGWNITNEKFMEKSQNWLNTLKLRLSYGMTGNEAIGVYQSLAKLTTESLAMNGLTSTGMRVNSTMGNADLSWEKTKTFNIGLDFGFFNNRINGNLDVYFARTNDLLMQRNLPKANGFSYYYANMGETANTGVEFSLTSRNIVKNDFSWTTNLVFSWNKNEIKDLYGDGQDDVGNRWFIGHPIDVIYDYTMVGIWQEDEIEAGLHKNWDPSAKAGDVKLADLNGDGQISDADKTVQGQTTPKWIGGLTNTFTYKNLSLNIFVQTVQGIMKYNTMLNSAADEMGTRNYTTEVGYWTPENRSNEYRSLSNNSNPHGYGFAQKANYTRIKDITLSYTFPESIIKKIGIGGLTIYASGRNLFTFTNWTGWDPEARDIKRGNSSYDSTREETVYDSSNYPMTKSYVFGLNLTF